MKSDVTQSRASSHWHAERLDGAIQVLVINRIFIVPDAGGRICHLVANEANAIDSWSRLNLGDGRSGPSHDGRLLLHGGSDGRKGETAGGGSRNASNTESSVGDI